MRLADLNAFDYTLPPGLIAQEHASPRDSSRLFVYYTQTGVVEHRLVRDLLELLPQKTRIVLNSTTVLPARITLYKPTGGTVNLLFLVNESVDEDSLLVLADAKLVIDSVLINELGDSVCQVLTHREHGKYSVRWLHPCRLHDYLSAYGKTPLPPYIKHNTQAEMVRRDEYQTIFADRVGEYASVAAPTASLHITSELLSKLIDRFGVDYVQLHVGLGTFASLTESNFTHKSLHTEFCSISRDVADTLIAHRNADYPLLAVGTTVVRTLESIDRLVFNPNNNKLEGWTDMFIYPAYPFTLPSMLMTNFHVPKSSLLLLVEAFLQHKHARHSLMQLYDIAIRERYRFYSLGDAMLIL